MSVEDNSDDEEQFGNIQEVPINERFRDAVQDAGASQLVLEIIEVDPEDLGVERNSVRQELRKYCYWADEISAEAIENKVHYGGDFFQKVWEGDMSGAFNHADSNNRAIMQDVTGLVKP